MKSIYIFFLLLLFPLLLCAQPLRQTRSFDSTYYSQRLDSLELLYGHNKKIPDSYKLPVLIALMHYPELQNSRIIFRKSRITTTLNIRPTTLSVLTRKHTNRKYIIRINNKRNQGQVLLPKVPFNAQIGLFGHELAHLVDYRQLNFFGLIRRLYNYIPIKKRLTYEQQVDYMTIQHGLGWQLYDWSDFVLNQSDAGRYYKRMKRFIYLTPDEIEALMQPKGPNIPTGLH